MELEPESDEHDQINDNLSLVFFFSNISKQLKEREMELSGAFVFLFPFS